MKIEQSAVAMSASHSFSSEYQVSFESERSFRTIFNGVSQTDAVAPGSATDREQRVLLLLETLIARMLALILGKTGAPVTDIRDVLKTEAAAVPEQDAAAPGRVSEMEWRSELTETVREHESADFSSTGQIQTADGRRLDFRLDLAMCRDFMCERKMLDSGKVELRDPLVINFDGKAAELSGKRFTFDLDADGRTESIDSLAGSSGYLAIDNNGDGRINDGSELFGTRSGNGFGDLAKLDSDGNHWLDEADPGFAALRVWQRAASGQDTLSGLHDKGVGALYLGSTETPFTLTDTGNRTLAQIRASGIYLREDGGAGSLQQIDLAV